MSLLSGLWRALRAVAAGIGFLYLIVSATPLVKWWARALAGPWHDPKGDVLIVLTGSVLDERTIGMNSYWRAVYAAHAFVDDGFREMIISGGGLERTPIAVPMREFVTCLGVPAAAVRLEITSTDTHESAVYLADLIRRTERASVKRRIVLLSSDYHMYRAWRVFRKAGLDTLPRPLPDAGKRASAWWERWTVFIDLVKETAKIGYYWARDWM
jgi:uncharacterized SAM-binding protein YcdF (DUF218 family)